VFFCYGYMWTAILLHLAPYAMDMGYSAGGAARLISLVGAGSLLGKVLLGVLADRIGDKATYQISFVVMGSALLWLVMLQQFWALAVFALFFGFAYGGLATSQSPLVAWLFGLRKHGLVFGACFNGFTLGCALGPIVSGHIFDITHSYRRAFMVCCGMAVAGLMFTIPLRPALMGVDAFADDDYRAEIQASGSPETTCTTAQV
jgi:MFS family permease